MIRKKTALHIFFTKNQRRRTWSRTSLRISKRELCRGEAGKMSRRRRAEEGRFVVVAKEFHGHSRSTENEEEQNLLCFLCLFYLLTTKLHYTDILCLLSFYNCTRVPLPHPFPSIYIYIYLPKIPLMFSSLSLAMHAI